MISSFHGIHDREVRLLFSAHLASMKAVGKIRYLLGTVTTSLK